MKGLIAKELLDFVKVGAIKLPIQLQINDKEKRLYRRVVKLMEELGELCDAILSYAGSQRQDKLSKYDPNRLSEEFADVLITLLLVGDLANIDVNKALRLKIAKIKKRYKK
ncbi:MAG: hypothetical protein UY20_C0002G0002 [Candidatus Yanofskybacteria bacterium GW2011_GWA1_48_10]|uniref:NTP pyrophosphohydrolase MazG-like domain-containing protein n=2 Tax=Candidatus Yanofskyibacteriota TaxID=1752733 RepID=A0A0G1U7D2_9BACT|nr:MAG: hypothetical protein UY20_C0002G0002 [Candidatus Yanofskybacteria bacterium GW2011_GWA1_48_10]OGN06002.1 MAG: hypothetical protein A2669_01380 [Candidatus Yanofskybacteria bacterium RIFCSPHIGHO2_01_FULL_48_25b]